MRFAAVIPAYNEAATVREIATRTLAHARHVAVVDDGSVDGTGRRLDGLGLAVLRNEENQGKAASLWRGFEWAMALGVDAVISLDADGQHRPEDIPRLLAAARRAPDHLVVAARLRGREATPRVRRVGQLMADFWIGWAAGIPTFDTQSGYRLYPARLLRELTPPSGRRQGFVFESEAIIEAARQGFGVSWVGIDALYGRNPRRSHYRAIADTAAIVEMVAVKLLQRGLYPRGLLRSLGLLGPSRSRRSGLVGRANLDATLKRR